MISLMLPIIWTKALLLFSTDFMATRKLWGPRTGGINTTPYNRMTDDSGLIAFINEGPFIRNDNAADNSVIPTPGLIPCVKF